MKLLYDPSIQVGDIIKTYHKGFWKLIKIERRFYDANDEKNGYGKKGDESSPLFHYKLIMTNDFKLTKSKRSDVCDAMYCTKVDINWISIQLTEFQKNMEEVKKMILAQST